MDPLHVIPEEKWPKLEEFLKKDGPNSSILTSWMAVRRRWNASHPGRNPAYVLCPFGEPENGLLAYGRTGEAYYSLTLYLNHQDLTKLRTALLQTTRIDWEKNIVCAVPQSMEQWFNEMLHMLGYQIHNCTTIRLYWLPKELPQTFKIRCPDDVYAALLQQKDIIKINSLWEFRSEGSENFLSECIQLNFGYGIYSKEDDRLLCWLIQSENGEGIALKTDRQFSRKGYARLIVEIYCKKMSDDGYDTICTVAPGNKGCEQLIVNQLKFQYVSEYSWIGYGKIKLKSLL